MLHRNVIRPHNVSHLRWRRALVALAIVLAFHLVVQLGYPAALVFCGYAEHLEPTPGQATSSITVMTFNLGNGLVAPDDLVSALREIEPDLVALLEVTPETAAHLETELSDEFPYREVRGLGIPGKALLSRYPISSAEWLELNPGRPDLLATVDLGERPIDVLVAHPPPPELNWVIVQPREGTVEQFDRIIEIAAAATNPFLLLGDLNVTSLNQRYRELESAGLQDVFGAVGSGSGLTFPVRLQQAPEVSIHPAVRIDYIWASEEWQPLSAHVGEDVGSDHLPVIARLELIDVSETAGHLEGEMKRYRRYPPFSDTLPGSSLRSSIGNP
jgi:endonuclease/exonuclease/phosphatase (EEP) superfamily protein YafD